MSTFFEIVKVTAGFSKKYADAPSKPHKHEYEEVIVLNKGQPTHFIDFNKNVLEAPGIIYVAQGKIHQFHPDLKTRGWALRFNHEFIPDTKFHFYSNFKDTISLAINAVDCLNNVNALCEMIYEENQQPQIDFKMTKHLLAALLARLEREVKKNVIDNSEVKNPDIKAFNNFLQILDSNYKRAEDVQFYADKMNTSVRNLNRISRLLFEKSVSEIIETRKLIEARQLLLNTNKTIAEIGFEIGYNEKSYFTRVFHKKVGATPSEFRTQMKSAIS